MRFRNRFRPAPLVAAFLVLGAATASAAVEVTFTNADKYVDGTLQNSRSDRSRSETQNALRKVFAKLGVRHLAPGETLTVNVTALDLAGEFEPWRVSADDIRFMRGITWPQMTFDYRVEGEGGVLASGTAKLTDMNYLTRINTYFEDDSLRYESQMLDDWFSHTFKATKSAR
jgi:hypothetical protein